MTVVRKASSVATTVKKKSILKSSIVSTRQPSQIEEMADTNFGTLDASKDGYVVTYDSTTDKFVLSTPDQVLAASAEDGDISDEFVTQLEQELDLGTISLEDVDGGLF